jgi:phenylacetate-CoA ligase
MARLVFSLDVRPARVEISGGELTVRDLWLRAFHNLPSPARSLVASVRGHYLASWRYGPLTDQLMAEAIEREQWSAARWQAYQDERLAKILHRASRHVPYYREHWAARRRRGDRASPEYLANWPILEKETVRANAAAFLDENSKPRDLFPEHTSGTSGTSLELWWGRETVQHWYALFEVRARQWHGVSREDRWAILGGQLVRSAAHRQPPFWVWNSGMKQLYMSSYHLAAALIPSYLDALRDYRITYLLGYTSSLFAVADEAVRLGQAHLPMKVAITNAEPVFDYQRNVISKAFQCPVRETYGNAELAAAASECAAGRLHLWPETGIVEVVDDDLQPVPAGEKGEWICTGLLNAEMPFIRYRIGDRGALGSSADPCACGRTLPQVASIDGRTDDVLYTVDGRPVGRLDPVFKERLPIREAQIVQETLGRIRVRFVPAPDFSASALDSLASRLRARLGPVEVVSERLDEIPRTSQGKFKAVVCQIPRKELERRKEGAASGMMRGMQ